jgi:hypothetical protein
MSAQLLEPAFDSRAAALGDSAPGRRTSVPVSGERAVDGCLPCGYGLREFVIERVLGEGGFGVVYAALDTKLERCVAIKEYMPTALATRNPDLSVQMRSAAPLRSAFQAGLRSFINEAKLLARYSHPALVKVHQFWEEKGTAYMVMPYHPEPTLRSFIRGLPMPPNEAWIRKFLLAAIDAVETLHHDQCLHRDIAPDNILVLNGVAPLLLDFGAARHVIGDMTQALTVVLKPGYAPIEQYADATPLKQGLWTDVYALSAVAYFMVTGKAPLAAPSRMLADDLEPAAQAAAGRYSQELLRAIDAGLAVRPEARLQSMAELRARLQPQLAAPAVASGGNDPTTIVMTQPYVEIDLDQLAPQSAAVPVIEQTSTPVVHGDLQQTLRPATLPLVTPETERAARPAGVAAQRVRVAGTERKPGGGAEEAAGVRAQRVRAAGTERKGERTSPSLSTLFTPAPVRHAADVETEPALPPSAEVARTRERPASTSEALKSRDFWLRPGYALAGVAAVVVGAIVGIVLSHATGEAEVPAPAIAEVAVAPVPQPIVRTEGEASAAAGLAPSAERTSGSGATIAGDSNVAVPAAAASAAPAALATTTVATTTAAASAPAARAKESAGSAAAAKSATKAKSAAPGRWSLSIKADPRAAADAAAVNEPLPVYPIARAPTMAPPVDVTQNPAATAEVAAFVAPAPPSPPPADNAIAALKPLAQPKPPFPRDAMQAGLTEGRVVAQLAIDAEGSVVAVQILEASDRSFNREVRRVLSKWRYAAPGQSRNTTVELMFRADN